MGRALPFLACLPLLLTACGPAGAGSPASEGTREVALPGEIDAGAREAAPEGGWSLVVAGDGSSRWTAPSGGATSPQEDAPPPGAVDLRVGVGERVPWGRVLRAYGGGTLRVPALTLWFETDARTARVPVTVPDAGSTPGRVHLEILLQPGEGGALVLQVSADGPGWWDRYGCEEPSRATWSWRGAPDGDLSAWLARAGQAAAHDPQALAVRVRGDPLDAAALTVGSMLDLLLAVLDARVADAVDLALPRSGRGYRRVDDPVEHDLRWLATHQGEEGCWSGPDWGAWCDGVRQAKRRPREAASGSEVGTTGAALCAFLGAGYSHRGNHAFAKAVLGGLRWLRAVQDASGRFSPSPAEHAWAALAMVEVYGMTESPVLRPSAEAALRVVLDRPRGGREDPRTLFLQTLVVVSARLIAEDARSRGRQATWEVEPAVVEGLLEDLARLDVRAGPLPRAVSLAGRHLLGVPGDVLREDIAALPLPGSPDASPDPTYVWIGTLATFRLGRPAWKPWEASLEDSVLRTQREGPPCCYGGSWDLPDGVLLPGGRVEVSAIYAMSLQVYYRYDKVVGIR